MKKIKYLPKVATALLFLLFLVANYLLFAGRKSDALQSEWLLNHLPDFYQHVANFTISCILYAGIGYAWLMLGVHTKAILFFGITIIAANFIYELWIPVLNTRDVVDAVYGAAGTAIGFIFLMLIKKFGLRLNSEWKEPSSKLSKKKP